MIIIKIIKKENITKSEIVTQLPNTFKGFARSYNIRILDSKDPTIQLNNTCNSILNDTSYAKDKLKNLLEKMRGFKF